MTETGVTYFSGGGLAALGMTQAGVQLVGAVEYDPAIAAVYAANLGGHCTVAAVEDVDPRQWIGVDWFQASPSCKHASVANSGAGETDEDTSAAAAVVRFLRIVKPRAFWLENVEGYARFTAYRAIRAALDDLGYWSHAAVVNSADYGVPQTRRRLILRAVAGGLWQPFRPLPAPVPWVGWYAAIADLIPTLPESAFAPWQLTRLEKMKLELGIETWEPIEYNEGIGGANYAQSNEGYTGEVLPVLRDKVGTEVLEQWGVGVLEGLCQAQILRPDMYGSGLRCTPGQVTDVGRSGALSLTPGGPDGAMRALWAAECTRRTSQRWELDEQLTRQLGAYLSALSHEGTQQARALYHLWRAAKGTGVLQQALSPFQEVWRSAICEDQDRIAQEDTDRDAAAQPDMGNTFQRAIASATVAPATGFLVSNAKTEYGDGIRHNSEPAHSVTTQSYGRVRAFLMNTSADKWGDGLRGAAEPAATLRTGPQHVLRAFLLSGVNGDTVRMAEEPAQTVTSAHGSGTIARRAWLDQGRVVRMTPRALARFQSVPDSYQLPEKAALACMVIGNGVPVLLSRRITESLQESAAMDHAA